MKSVSLDLRCDSLGCDCSCWDNWSRMVILGSSSVKIQDPGPKSRWCRGRRSSDFTPHSFYFPHQSLMTPMLLSHLSFHHVQHREDIFVGHHDRPFLVLFRFNEENPGSLIGSQPFRVIRDPPGAAERLTTSPIFLGSSEDLSLQRILTA
ncbi:hypothetical protein LXL04_015776 [Taraxacum kok-saghyz]